MLNRRHLRIKAFQALYAHAQSAGGLPAKTEKELFLGIERTFDLYTQLLLLFGELRRLAEERIEGRKNKRLPTAEDLGASRAFVDMPALVLLAESPRLLAESEKRKLGWMGQRDLLAQLYKLVEQSPEFAAWMANPDPATGGNLLAELFVEHMAQNDGLHEFFEQKSIHWLEDFDLAATMVMRTLEVIKPGDPELKLTELDHGTAEEREFVSGLYRETVANEAADTKTIADNAPNWDAERIALSDMLLMRMALNEARSFELIPVKVTMNEYIEIAKAYSSPKSTLFINGVLDKLFAVMKQDGTIRKVGGACWKVE
jgi:N utilization substance protein B